MLVNENGKRKLRVWGLGFRRVSSLGFRYLQVFAHLGSKEKLEYCSQVMIEKPSVIEWWRMANFLGLGGYRFKSFGPKHKFSQPVCSLFHTEYP